MINLRDCSLEPSDDGPTGHRFRSLHPARELGAKRTGFGVYELDPGQATWPYHFELGSEEWLLVIEGEVVVRTPDGELTLHPGDVMCFPEGPAGAHGIRNDSGTVARFAMPSVDEPAGAAIYPDSGKLLVYGPGFRHRGWIGDEVEYWEGE
ncbi:MAG TPA: cupin domain-containing protein [Gaiellaceae bacterium]|nr:cupin domain-containing protein [Gaiellaceae bacterium]